eukprot:g2876.t1
MDVWMRATSFWATVLRDTAQLASIDSEKDVLEDLNIVIITHGLTLRLLLMRYFQLQVSQFEQSLNPANAELVVMERATKMNKSGKVKAEWYQLDKASQKRLNLHDVTTRQPSWLRNDGRLLAKEMNFSYLDPLIRED